MNFALTEATTLRMTITLTRADADGLQRLLDVALGRYREVVVNLGWLPSVPAAVSQVLGFSQSRAARFGARLRVARTDAAFQHLVRPRPPRHASGWADRVRSRIVSWTRGC
ncbi:MAG TPA: hypothetical protein VGO93_29390 [Candidatus Xenobia bacterium]|jgi:hypothetical protein